MAFKTVNDLSTDDVVALGGYNKKLKKENPTTLTGYYIGSKEVDSPKSKTGKAFIHIFQTPKGNVGVWGKTDLDRKIKSAVLGALTRVSFDGMLSIPGKNDMYKYKVEVDADNTIEVAAPEASSDSYSESDDAPVYDEPLDEEEDVDAAPAFTQTARGSARQPTAEQAARVKNLLSSRK